jgi:serine/threonine-protein kinase
MGEVYRARDGTLQRDVALKILPELFALDSDRLARFRREAQVLASLNHPNVAAIYGFEESTAVHALVLELVEGPTLAERIAQGPIPLDEALLIARQLAEALEAAHEHGVIHRDLKPANIKVTSDGVVKVLDFGLAKLTAPGDQNGPHLPNNLSLSPTITSPAMTGIGVILGTAAYMSPEQAKGREAGKRSDVWAFGCVVYEMLTGRRAFDGEDITEVLGAVVRLEPRWDALPSDVPQSLRTLLQRCLVKDRRARIADIAAALFVLNHQANVAATDATEPTRWPPRPLWRGLVAPIASALVIGIVVGVSVWFVTRPAAPHVQRFTIAAPAELASSVERSLAITPDGTRVVYVGNNNRQLFVRPLDQLEPEPIATTANRALRGIFISPDGQSVGFAQTGAVLMTVPITGGPATTVTQMDGASRGATWAPNGTIIFATVLRGTGLQRVAAAGGRPTLLTTPNREQGEGDHWWPELLPGGKGVLFTIVPANGVLENAQIALLDLERGTWRILIRGGSHAHYVASGHLVYGTGGTLRAVEFDADRMEVVGNSVAVVEDVVATAMGALDASVAANGSLVYIPGGAGGGPLTVVMMDRQGHPSPVPGIPPGAYRDVRVSPGGAQIAVADQNDVWIYDFARTTFTPLTTDRARDYSPLWAADGRRIVFTSTRGGHPELWERAADGTGTEQRFFARAAGLVDLRANEWSADGSQLLFTEVAGTSNTIAQIPVGTRSDPKVLVNEDSPSALSPDGRWVAYESAVSGQRQVFVDRYPELGQRQQISTDGGARPLWSRDGGELFFTSVDGGQMLAAAVPAGTALPPSMPRMLFEPAMLAPIRGNRPYDIAPDGRFVVIRSGQAEASGAAPSQIVLIQNWFEELKRLVPVN